MFTSLRRSRSTFPARAFASPWPLPGSSVFVVVAAAFRVSSAGAVRETETETEVEGVLLVVAGCDEFEVGVLGMALLQGLHDLAAHFSGQHTWVRSRTHSPRQDCGQLVRLTGLLVIC